MEKLAIARAGPMSAARAQLEKRPLQMDAVPVDGPQPIVGNGDFRSLPPEIPAS